MPQLCSPWYRHADIRHSAEQPGEPRTVAAVSTSPHAARVVSRVHGDGDGAMEALGIVIAYIQWPM